MMGPGQNGAVDRRHPLIQESNMTAKLLQSAM